MPDVTEEIIKKAQVDSDNKWGEFEAKKLLDGYLMRGMDDTVHLDKLLLIAAMSYDDDDYRYYISRPDEYYRSKAKAVRLFLDMGAKPTQQSHKLTNGKYIHLTPLSVMFRNLCREKSNRDGSVIPMNEGDEVSKNELFIIRLLLQHRKKLTSTEQLFFAYSCNSIQKMELLPLLLGCGNKIEDFFNFDITASNIYNMFDALANPQLLDMFLENGMDPHVKEPEGRNLFMIALDKIDTDYNGYHFSFSGLYKKLKKVWKPAYWLEADDDGDTILTRLRREDEEVPEFKKIIQELEHLTFTQQVRPSAIVTAHRKTKRKSPQGAQERAIGTYDLAQEMASFLKPKKSPPK